MATLEVSLSTTPLFHIGPVPVNSSVLCAYLVSLILILIAWSTRRGMGLIPSRMQVAVEVILMHFLDALRTVFAGHEKRSRKYLPYFLTLFLFVLVMNQLSLVPFIFDLRANAVPMFEGIPFLMKPGTGTALFHTSTAHWSQTLTLALMTVLGAHVIGFCIHPLRHINNYIRIGRFFQLKSPMDLVFGMVDILLGVLEFFGDIAKVISLSARLFGNLFAGEVMVMVFVILIFPFFSPTLIILLGILGAIVQAYVFSFLSLQFMTGTIEAARGEQ